ncbi:hypothetical protein ABMA27_006497 [Loxostege sticticalis]|uniref:Big brain n=1 Tax=Loxostege sticticalis TaxID=481309 RepID=A0ABR3IJH2_LOXSC
MERRWTGAAPALLGAAYTAASLVSMPSLNPARSLGPSFVLSRWDSHWVCWVGGVGGGVGCALLLEWGTRRARSGPGSRPAFPHHYRHAATYCAASAPRPDTSEPLYSGTKSLYCRSPPPARHPLHRSQSVYSKGSATPSASAGATGGALATAQSLLLRPHAHAHLTHNQNAHNAQRDPAYGTTNGARPGPAGAAVTERRESVYSSGAGSGVGAPVAGGARRGPLPSDDSAYGSGTYRPYRPALAHPHPHTPPDHY